MNTIEFIDVCKSYDGKHNVIDKLNLEIPSGQRLVLLGPSGCGKTTILRMIAGLEAVTSGDLFMGGERVNDLEPGERNVAMVFQNYALYPHMTVEQNIRFGMEIAKIPKDEQLNRLNWALSILGLEGYKDRHPKELSGGQRQRVALCRALVKKSPYFLLDEPLSNLDAQLRTTARAELVKIHEVYSPTFVYVTHDQVEAMTVGQRIVVIDKSVVQQYDTPDSIYNRPRNVFVAKFIGSPSMNVCEAGISDGCLCIADGRVKIPDAWMNIIGGRDKVQFGLRPEHMILDQAGEGFDVSLNYIENHGNLKCISFNVGESTMMTTTDPTFAFTHGMKLVIPWEKVHFFDNGTKINLGYPD